MKKIIAIMICALLVGCGGGSSSQSNDTQNTGIELGRTGGVATVEYNADNGFLQFVPELDIQDYRGASQGRELFIAKWLPAPAGRDLIDGFGPLAITDACAACHESSSRAASLNGDGSTGNGILFRLRDENGFADPFLGPQLQSFSADGNAEGRVTWTTGSSNEILFHLNDAMNPLHDGIKLAPRLSPQLIGMGLLDLVPEEVIAQNHDPYDHNTDGISGRIHVRGECTGRFGWKGIHCTLEEQIAGAFQQDMGLTSKYHTTEPCTEHQDVCELLPSGGTPEVSDASLIAINDFLMILAVPARRVTSETDFIQGRDLFNQVGCNGCHRETLHTAEVERFPILSNQTFYPYTDLLLHDMGPELSDGAKEGDAEPSEWRTPPLWGLGLIEGDGKSRFLHDGRAEDLQSAITWHGGEALAAKQAFVALSEKEKQLLLSFLRSI